MAPDLTANLGDGEGWYGAMFLHISGSPPLAQRYIRIPLRPPLTAVRSYIFPQVSCAGFSHANNLLLNSTLSQLTAAIMQNSFPPA